MIITHYDSMCNVIYYYCEACKLEQYKEVTNISDNCAIKIDVLCKKCGKTTSMYYLRCTDMVYAKTLQAELEKLHETS